MGFSIQADLSNTEPWDATKTFEDLPPGQFKVKTTEVEEYQKPGGKKSLHFVFEVAEGALKGKRGDVYIGLDFEVGNGVNKRKLISALVSHGAKQERIKAAGANLNITEAHFVGKHAFIIVREPSAEAQAKAKAENRARALTDKEYVTPEQFAEIQKTAAALAGANGAATAAPTAAPTTAQPPAKADDLFGP